MKKYIEVMPFGFTSDGKRANIYTLTNINGVKLKVTNFGATAVSITLTSTDGHEKDVILGFDDVKGYEETGLYLGATIGRYAGQINDGSFSINGEEFSLYKNDKNNTLHGGEKGFDKRMFEADIDEEKNGVYFSYLSPDMEEGFPGNLKVGSEYILTDDNEIIIRHRALSDKDTVLNMTHHSYFNLNGHDSGSILNHSLKINSSKYTEVANDCSPNGIISEVVNTPLDFREFYKLGDRINNDFSQLNICEGYDHNWVIDEWNGEVHECCELINDDGSVSMKVLSDLPGLQMYSGNYLSGSEIGKKGCPYGHRTGLCLEPQFYPNSLKNPHFPSPILKKDEPYIHTIIYKFEF